MPRPLFRWCLAAVWLLLFVAQLFAFWGELRPIAEQTFHPSHTDATEYVERAVALAGGSWDLTLDTAWRMPGYPLLLALAFRLGLDLDAVRVLQLAATGAVPLGLAWTARRLGLDRRWALAVAVLAALYAPLYWFASWIFAEAPSAVVAVGLIAALAHYQQRPTGSALAWIGAAIWVLTALKPNHLVLVVPTAALIAATPRGARLAHLTLLGLGLAATLAPWSLLASAGKLHPVLLTTTDGVNLWIGVAGREPTGDGTLVWRAAQALGLWDAETQRAVDVAAGQLADYSAKSAVYKEAALARVVARPVGVVAFAAAKVAHLNGLSLRGIVDFVWLVFSAVQLVAGIALTRTRHRAFAWMFLGSVFALWFQAALFLPNYRFRVVFADPLGLLILVLAAAAWRERRAVANA